LEPGINFPAEIYFATIPYSTTHITKKFSLCVGWKFYHPFLSDNEFLHSLLLGDSQYYKIYYGITFKNNLAIIISAKLLLFLLLMTMMMR
jgi:hypothetical protein